MGMVATAAGARHCALGRRGDGLGLFVVCGPSGVERIGGPRPPLSLPSSSASGFLWLWREGHRLCLDFAADIAVCL